MDKSEDPHRAAIIAGVDRLQPHQPEQPPDSFVIDLMTLQLSPGGHSPDAVKRRARVLFIKQPHQSQIFLTLGARLIVKAGAIQAEQLALTAQAQAGVIRFDQLELLAKSTVQLFFEPVNFNLELTDLLIELRFQRLVVVRRPLASGAKQIRQAFDGVLLPLRDLIGCNS